MKVLDPLAHKLYIIFQALASTLTRAISSVFNLHWWHDAIIVCSSSVGRPVTQPHSTPEAMFLFTAPDPQVLKCLYL
ncbi:hypothetical protein F5148DRAFT_1175230 [Russula earlei]|uniref:Uncharacterized protein n=1 Tax=Russula earlei TaxID=71964 RepID=A0ACC0UHB1_9AGAM|nr:hypothetical protein F5148DRAFT_1175230 [Russula earlei]